MTDRTTIIFDGKSPNRLACDTTLRPMPDGSWVMVMLGGGDHEPLPENQVFITRSLDQGTTWSPLIPLDLGFPRQGDTIALVPTELMVYKGRCTLFVATHDGTFAAGAWKEWMVTSTDSCRTFGSPAPAPGRLHERTFIRNHIVTRDGRLLLPFQHYLTTQPPVNVYANVVMCRPINPRNGVLMSGDGGQTWTEHGDIRLSPDDDYHGWAENNIVELADGRIAMIIRADGLGGVLYYAESTDGGRTWPEFARKTDIPNPGSKATLYSLGGDTVALLHNPNPKHRSPLALWISKDGLRTWPHQRVLVPESCDRVLAAESCNGPTGWLNYPDGFVSADKQWLHFAFDDSRHRAVYYGAVLPPLTKAERNQTDADTRHARRNKRNSSMTPPQSGRQWPSELALARDPVSGATVRQLTNYRAHSNHSYFTYPCWYDHGSKLVIASDRDNRVNLFGVDLESGALTQLTDWDPAKVTNRHSLSKNPVREEIAFYYDNAVQVLDLATLKTRRLMECPKGYTGNLADFTADGKYLVTGFCQDLSDRFQVDLLNGYIGFNEMWAAKPHSTIWKIPLAGGEPQLVHEDRSWLGHFNASPKLPNIMTFCHEGPWDKVDNRIWGLDIETGRTWKIRPTVPGECVGHEYWMSDGERIGYHGGNQKGGLYGSIRYDNTDPVEAPFSGHCWHFHSYMLDLVIGDGNAQEPYLLAWRFRNGVFEGPKVLAWHRGSFHSQQLHVHPAVHANGTKVLYTADPQAYGQVFIVDVPAWDALPDRAAVTKNKEV